MPLINISADFRLLNRLLERIANVLERIALEAYGVRLGHCTQRAEDAHPEVEPTVEYADDVSMLREKVIELEGLIRERDQDSAVTQDRP